MINIGAAEKLKRPVSDLATSTSPLSNRAIGVSDSLNGVLYGFPYELAENDETKELIEATKRIFMQEGQR